MSAIAWRFSTFDSLSASELYVVLQLRSEVFVVEQACIFQDLDGADQKAMHLLGTQDGGLVAYARCFGAGVLHPEASIGRIVTRPAGRGRGIGSALVEQAIACLSTLSGASSIRIGAQARLVYFYRRHGFEVSGPPYLEDGIAHVGMLRHV